jgi:hypothetical protein
MTSMSPFAMPGFMQAMNHTLRSFLRLIDDIGVLLPHHLVLAGYGGHHGVFRASPMHRRFSRYLAPKLGLNRNLADSFL